MVGEFTEMLIYGLLLMEKQNTLRLFRFKRKEIKP